VAFVVIKNIHQRKKVIEKKKKKEKRNKERKEERKERNRKAHFGRKESKRGVGLEFGV
jgi:hypothetical protein